MRGLSSVRVLALASCSGLGSHPYRFHFVSSALSRSRPRWKSFWYFSQTLLLVFKSRYMKERFAVPYSHTQVWPRHQAHACRGQPPVPAHWAPEPGSLLILSQRVYVAGGACGQNVSVTFVSSEEKISSLDQEALLCVK